MTLTHLTVSNAKPRAKAYKLADADSLYLVVQPSGTRLWRMNYRYLGKQKTLHLGAWPAVSIAAARANRDDARQKLAAGFDPAVEKKVALAAARVAANNTFKGVAEEWVIKNEREGRATVTLEKIRWLLKMAYPVIGHLPIAQISPQDALSVLRKVEATGRYESARRMRSVLSRVFRYAIATARTQRDVAGDLRGALITPRVTHLAAITTLKAAGELLRAIDGYSGHEITAIALELSPHLFVRPGELRRAEWEELDIAKAIWAIPAEKMKMRRPHRVSLSRQVLDRLDRLRKLTGHGRYLFPSFRSSDQCMSENTVNGALRRLGYSQSEMTAHGFRAMAGCRYLDDGDRQRVYVVDGWNVTGDTYRCDRDGYFHFVARSDDMIVSSGYNIGAPEVENALCAHAAVQECAVVGAPCPERGMKVKAFIVAAPGNEIGPALVKALQDHVKARIAPYKYPREIVFLEALPKTATGKIQRFALRHPESQP